MTKTEEKELKEIMSRLEDIAVKYNHQIISMCAIVKSNKIYSNCFECDNFDITNRRTRKEFKPHLYSFANGAYGIVGTETNLKDIRGEKLYVGDVVTVVSGAHSNYGKTFVIETDGDYFVMGIRGACEKDRTINAGWTIIKEKSFEELTNNEIYDDVTAILENNE